MLVPCYDAALGAFLRRALLPLHRYRLHIVAEVVTSIDHCLLALPGVALGDLRRVVSDPPALAHCDPFIRGLPGLVREAVDDTAGAAKLVAANGWRWAWHMRPCVSEACRSSTMLKVDVAHAPLQATP
jgi:prephenate dehydratase